MTYLHFTIQRMIVVEPNFDKRTDSICKLRAAMKDKQITIPTDAQDILTKASDAKFVVLSVPNAVAAASSSVEVAHDQPAAKAAEPAPKRRRT